MHILYSNDIENNISQKFVYEKQVGNDVYCNFAINWSKNEFCFVSLAIEDFYYCHSSSFMQATTITTKKLNDEN